MTSGAKLKATGEPIRMFITGYPGSGKTGSIAGLLDAGFKVRVLDFEGNTTPITHFAEDRGLNNLDVQTLQDAMRKDDKNRIVPAGIPTAFNNALTLMTHWKGKEADGTEFDLGIPAQDWGPDTVLVVDSLTALGEAALRRATTMRNETPSSREIKTWGIASDDQSSFLKMIGSKRNRFHVVVIAHLQMIGPDDFIKLNDSKSANKAILDDKMDAIANGMIGTKLFPVAVTKNLSQNIHKEYPILLKAERAFVAGQERRFLYTTSGLELDTKFPAKAPNRVPVEDGLPKLFELLGAKAPGF